MMDSRKPTDTLIWQTLDRDSLGVTEAMWEAFCRSGPIYDSDCRAAEAIMYEFEDWREKERTRALVRRTANELGDLLFYDEFLYDPETAAEIGPKA